MSHAIVQKPLVWRRKIEAPSSRKSCSHTFCPWQHCELRMHALFWAENPTLLNILEESNPARRKNLLQKSQINLYNNHVTIIQYCDQKTRTYYFKAPDIIDNGVDNCCRQLSLISCSHELFSHYKPTFAIVYEHKNCLQAGYSTPIIAHGNSLADSLYYRRCDGRYRNASGDVLDASHIKNTTREVHKGDI